MVSQRCKIVVKSELKSLGLHYTCVELGVADILENISDEKREKLRSNLLLSGLELMEDKKSMLIEKIKIVITEMIHYNDELPKVNFSEYLSTIMGYDYTYLSNIFSEVKGITKDENNQPVLKTTKGDQKLFKPRISKLEDK